MRWLFLLAYTCSGMAGLIYEVTWTRLLTLYVGHTTAAASAVVAAFLGGLAIGAAIGGRVASRLAPRDCVRVYALLEVVVAVAALLLPLELQAFTPLLRWAYADGDAGWLFSLVRLTSCVVMVFVPATALGATFPMAVRWMAERSARPARQAGLLYALNTVGAAAGALLAGFTLIPAIGLAWTTRVGVGASLFAAACAFLVAQWAPAGAEAAAPAPAARGAERKGRRAAPTASPATASVPLWLPALVLGVSGCASLMHEIVWTRILALLLGPTTYAFAAALAAVITGVALGSAIGSAVVGRTPHPARWLAGALAGAAITSAWTSALAGGWVPRYVAHQMATSAWVLDQLFREGSLLTALLVIPTAICFGAAFPLALALPVRGSEGEPAGSSAARFGIVYAINTIGAVTGSLLAGFVLVPLIGLQGTLTLVSVTVVAIATLAVAASHLTRSSTMTAAAGGIVVLAVAIFSPPWDRALLASGSYLYAPYMPKDLDLEMMLKAGSLLYYREGASATVSVKQLTGTTTLAVDGKVDASNRSDMLTQKLIAHLPLLLHDAPKDVAIVGLGSGVTLGAALRHPIAHADVVELSAEVVEASAFFADDNGEALRDPRTRLLVGDGRSHVLLADRQYDVIVSEPSNPWIAGVAALFTREFFAAARARLAPGGIICQWAHTYNISDGDLRSIVATFTSVFPDATLWLVGSDDLLMVASNAPLAPRLGNLARSWNRAGVAADLATVKVSDPFSILSLYGGGAAELQAYAAGADLLTDDRMTLEFSGPRELHRSNATDNNAQLAALAKPEAEPAAIKAARTGATAESWRHRAEMLAHSDMHDAAYDDFVRALSIDHHDEPSLSQIVREAVLTGRAADALSWVRGLTINDAPHVPTLVALSQLLEATGAHAEAIATATRARQLAPADARGAQQLASLHAEAGDLTALDQAVETLRAVAPDGAAAHYYTAVALYLHGDTKGAVASATRARAADPAFAPLYDLLGSAHARLGQLDEARTAFQQSLALDAHDSSAYANLGVIEQAAGHPARARGYFAEALSLDPDSPVARAAIGASSP